MSWIKDNIGKVLTATALLFSVVGFLTNTYIQQQTLVKEIEKLQLQIQDIKDGDLWWIKQKLNHAE